MGQDTTADALVQAARAGARMGELTSRLLAHAETVAVHERNASPSMAVWHANATRSTKRDSFRQVRLAEGLGRYGLVREALGRGDLVVEQASVICTALDELPDDLDAGVLEQAAKALVSFAEVHDAEALRVLGRRILEVVAPEVAEAWEADKLAEEEREAEKTSVFRIRDDGQGRMKGSFTVPLLTGQMLERALLAFAAPKHQIVTRTAHEGHDGQDGQTVAPVPVRRPTTQRLGSAFVELIERLDPDGLPRAGGVNATVVVTMTFESLRDGLAAATLDTGARGCDAPPAMCHAHHDDPWSCHGHTDLARGRLLCPFHHRRIHDPGYEVDVGPDNEVSLHRRT